ncbi:short chain dehydrogenase [Halogranum amylolyticum]|uniref:Short chain dehydrogenase n=1 Tax=Halogranum amylolyticum TaxID=660520 RepID=A0A1H8PID3_9EURY|nr:SDR family oxidoreductase [Halogranum amylolyticum]SEO41722.1 short chain dehydrogenase [Halogranum amylolyticum]
MKPDTVLITGCSSGIGRATARAFLAEDWKVYATARNPADIETLGDEGCELATLDVTDQGDVDRVVDRIVEEDGHIQCLVNNAGFGQLGPIEDVPTEQVHRQFDVNVYGPHRLTRAVLPHMREQGDGTIVNVSSVIGRISIPGMGVYAGSKFAVEAMTDALRGEVEEYGIDAVLVEPGPVDTRFQNRVDDEVNGDDEKEIQGIERSGAYESFYKAFSDTQALGGGGPGAVAPERVAEDIVNAASATKPAARYPVGTLAQIGVLARFLPDGVRDKLVGLMDKLA